MKERLIIRSIAVFLVALLISGCQPTASQEPTPSPTEAQVAVGPTAAPTDEPAAAPTDEPAAVPTEKPTAAPTEAPAVAPTEAPDEPVVLRVGGLIDADCWNPYGCNAPYMWGLLVNEGFATLGSASEGCPGQPRLAESWEVSEDGRTWTIRLHDGITYSDGTPLTAHTVKEFLDWGTAHPDIASWFTEWLLLESVEVIDDLTLQYTTLEPMVGSPDSIWSYWFILPPHIWTELDESEIFTFEFYPPVGTGPYVLEEHVPGSHIIFNARDDYYGGKPPIDRIVYQVYANTDALVSALLTGEIDLTTPNLAPETFDVLQSAPDITIEEKYPGDVFELVFNMDPNGTGHAALRDPAVRLAIDHAIDKEQMVEVPLIGHGITCPTNWACGPNFEGELNPDLGLTPFDPDEANQILEEAGYADSDGDGIRESPDGEPLDFRLYYVSEFPTELAMSELIKDALSRIGMNVEVEAMDWATWGAFVPDQHDFDMAIGYRTPETDPAAMDFWLSCWAAEPGPFTLNSSAYCNEEMDAMVAGYLFSNDEAVQMESIYEAQRILNEDRPMIVLAGPMIIQAYRNDRFEFPMDTCYVNVGMDGPHGVLNAVVK